MKTLDSGGNPSPRTPCTETEPLPASVPGKIFIIGEYAVTQGYPAVVAAVPPRFELLASNGAPGLHPESPAGRLLENAGLSGDGFEFRDPLGGRGGFGASTASFALLYRALVSREASWKEIWRVYRELTADSPLPPSGADLAVQVHGGVQSFFFGREPCLSDLDDEPLWERFLFFSATSIPGRKVATHEHLDALDAGGEDLRTLAHKLSPVVEDFLYSMSEEDAFEAGRCLTDFAERLSRRGLEHPDAAGDRRYFCAQPGVLGAKGAGAMLADGLVMIVAEDADRERLCELAANRGLTYVCDGARFEEGWRTDG